MNSKIICEEKDDIYKSGVYKIFHVKKPNTFYVGSTSKIDGRKGKIGFSFRFYQHLCSLRLGKHYNKSLQSICNEYGIEGITMQVLEVCNPTQSLEREQYYLDFLNPSFNILQKSDSSTGYRFSTEDKAKLSVIRKGRKQTDETKRKQSEAKKGKMPKNILTLRSAEVIRKSSETRRGRKTTSPIFFDVVSSPVVQLTLNHEKITEFKSIKDAAQTTGVNKSAISLSASGKRKTAGGFKWAYRQAI